MKPVFSKRSTCRARVSLWDTMVSILLVDDHTIFRDGLKRLLHEENDLRVAAETADAGEALLCLRTTPIDVVLLDINMKGRSGLDILPSIKAEKPALPVIILSMYPAETYALRALDAGASGYIAKDMDFHELVTCIRRVAAGSKYFPAEILDRVLRHSRSDDAEEAPQAKLSSREFEIMMLIVKGQRLTDIGTQLFLSVKTVSTYRSRIMQKLNLGNNAELVQYALRHKLID